MKAINKKTYTSPTTAIYTINRPKLLNGSIIMDNETNAHVDVDTARDYDGTFGARGDDWDED